MKNLIIDLEKKELRIFYKNKRRNISKIEILKKSQIINFNFLKLIDKISKNFSKAIFALYIPRENEVETKVIKEFLEKNNIKFSYPKIDNNNKVLEFIEFNGKENFINNNDFKDLLELESGNKVIPNFIIIPLLAYDKKCNRLGMGKGFYDRTLSLYSQKKYNFYTIGLGYSLQQHSQDLPTSKYDFALDFIVSEDGIFSRDQTKSLF